MPCRRWRSRWAALLIRRPLARAVYAHLGRLEAIAAAAGLPVHRVSAGDLRADTIGARHEARRAPVTFIPAYAVPDGGGPAKMISRQCTREYKIRPIRRRIRELLAAAGARRAVQVFGISADEVGRMRDSDVAYLEHAYPLVEAGMRRADCAAAVRRLAGIEPPRSACVGCPFHTDREWRQIRADPVQWADAVEADHSLRVAGRPHVGVRGTMFLHRSGVPLDEVDLSTPEDHGQLTLGFEEECQGVCGV